MPSEVMPDEVSESGEDYRDYERLDDDLDYTPPITTNDEEDDENTDNPVYIRTTSMARELADSIVRLAPVEELKELLDMGVDVNAKLRHGLSPLHYAVWQRYIEAARMLIDAGADINARDNIGYSALHLSAEHGYTDVMELLLKHNAIVNFNIPDPLDEEYPINVFDEPLRLALKHNHFEAAKLLLENGANPHTKYFFGSEINLVNPLNSDLLHLLLSYGADPNARDRHGFTPLMKTCRLQQEDDESLEGEESIPGWRIIASLRNTLKGMESCLLLISFGADPNIRTDARHDHRSVLHYAVLSGSTAIVNLLIKQGANVRFEENYNKSTPLHLSILKGDVQMVKLLIEAGSNTNAVSSIIGSPLHMACSEGVQNRFEIMELLLKNGANPNKVIIGDDESPIRPPLAEYLSIEKPEVDIVNLLLRHGTQVIMQSQNRHPNGVLNSLPNLSKYPKVLIAVLEAAQKFDLSLILHSSLIDKDQREMYLKVGQSPLTLKNTLRLFIRNTLGNTSPDKINNLVLPPILKKYLLYEIS